MSFAVFCVIAVCVVVGVHYFLFQSRIPLQASVQLARGTPRLIGTDTFETALTRPTDITYNSALTTDEQAQATITFTDPYRADPLVATITAQSDSSLKLRQGSRPRFDWSGDAYWIDFDAVYGRFDVLVADAGTRPVILNFRTTLGASARLTSGGHYTLIASDERVQLINFTGDALLVASDLRSQPVPTGQTASFQTSTDRFTLVSHPDVLGDAGFTENNFLVLNSPPARVDSQAWVCNNTVQAPGEPMGVVSLAMVDGRRALSLFRGDNAESHGESSCWHGLGTSTGGLDVSPYNSVTVRATFKIESQTLSTCGTVGSECPLMLAMDYIPANGGNPMRWVHGFYAFVDPNRGFPQRCDSCSELHEQINPGVWYTYEIANLFESFAPQNRPQSILNLRFYASGHQYEVYVSQVVMLVDQVDFAAEAAD
ncbi:MAG: hypothetical protein IT319_10930 [Anaerolineae bacterium]|nr:hypothetical protein [Anaerolineae bacterium]